MPLLQGDSDQGNAQWTSDITSPLTTTDGVASGTARAIGGRAFASIADSAAITNTVDETVFGVVYTMPAATLKLGSTVRVRAVVHCPSTNGTNTLRIKGQIGGQDVVTSASVDVANGDRVIVEYFLVSRAAPGATVSVKGGGTVVFTTGASGTPATADTLAGGVTLNTNGPLSVGISAKWSAASAANQCILETLIVDVL